MAEHTKAPESLTSGPSPMSEYVYDRNVGHDHMRILTLRPGTSEQTVQCSLTTKAVDAASVGGHCYEALSYAWGPENDQQEISCDGKTLSITKDLHTALLCLRDAHLPRTLWIDQICINQKDKDERSAQVTIMGTLYRSAQRVVVWLGEESENSDLALDFVEKLNRALLAYQEAHPSSHIAVSECGKILGSTGFLLPSVEAPEWLALSELYSRRWFGRLWVVQEVLLNQNVVVQCGHSFISMEAIEQLASHTQRYGFWVALIQHADQNSGHKFMSRIQLLRASLKSMCIEDVMIFFALQGAKVPHDRIYGVLSLLNESEQRLVRPDYNKSAARAYTELARVILEVKKRKSILNYAELGLEQSQIGAPSWVPDWTSQPHYGKAKSYMLEQDAFCASKSTTERWSFTNHGKTLRIRGVQVDGVVSDGLRYPFPEFTDTRNWSREGELQWIRKVSQFFTSAKVLAGSCKAYTGIDPDMLLCLTCIRGSERGNGNKSSWHDLLRLFRDFIESMQAEQNIFETEIEIEKTVGNAHTSNRSKLRPEAETTMNDFGRSFATELRNNYITKTEIGMLASLPPQCRIGDIVAILYGWDTPFLLRPVPTGYLLVGECYVHGIMHGEAVQHRLGTETDFDIV